MTLDDYNEAMQKILAEQQKIAQSTATLAMAGKAVPGQPEFMQILSSQWALMQQLAQLNTELMMGVLAPRR